MFDIYEDDKYRNSRFLLGREGKNKLFAVGLNPSTADNTKSDTTISKIRGVAERNGFDGFIVVDLCPLRHTKPDELPYGYDNGLMSENIERVFGYAGKQCNPVFWCAWGESIKIRNYLTECCGIFIEKDVEINAQWKRFGALTKKGHPRHPSRVRYGWKFQDFNALNYIEELNG